ncbi:MAG TPA: hypothetical protein VKY74_08925 [Chloroflexia bacterium]|nr:hypothetical protein [Chloroflexia bacterium]
MIPNDKVNAFLRKAGELDAAGYDPLSSTAVFTALGWTETERQYFRGDTQDVVRFLERGHIVHTVRAANPTPGGWLEYEFSL